MRELRKQRKTHRAELLFAPPTVVPVVIVEVPAARRAEQVTLNMLAARAATEAEAAVRQGHRVQVEGLVDQLVDYLEGVQAATVETMALQEATTAEAEAYLL